MKGVTLEEVSPFFIQAVLATEDQAFYRHRGFSVRAILGAFYDNLRHMRKVRGGSTITQQIVKNLFLSREKTYIRKLKEVLLAVQLETMFERRYGEGYKRKLLELYMNGSFYGTNAYGVEDAAQTYFGKRAADLNLQEAAVLAGLPNAPSALSPFREGGEHTTQRVRHVLRRMRAAGFITQEEMDRAVEDAAGVCTGAEAPQPDALFCRDDQGESGPAVGAFCAQFWGVEYLYDAGPEDAEGCGAGDGRGACGPGRAAGVSGLPGGVEGGTGGLRSGGVDLSGSQNGLCEGNGGGARYLYELLQPGNDGTAAAGVGVQAGGLFGCVYRREGDAGVAVCGRAPDLCGEPAAVVAEEF